MKKNISNSLKKMMPMVHFFIVKRITLKEYNKRKRICQKSVRSLIQYVNNKVTHCEHPLDLDNPRTFHDKLNWMKLYWYDERAFKCCDKYLVREYVESKGLGFLLNELLGVYDAPDEIDFEKLPNQFVLKTTHDSAHTIICKNKKEINKKLICKNLEYWLKINYEYMNGEWPYYSKQHKIVCEKFLPAENGDLLDYKVFCFGGEPYCIFLASDRENHAKADFYNLNWELQNYKWMYERSNKEFQKPKNFEAMIQYAKILSEGFPFARVDFYEVDGKLIFGEITLFHGGGTGWFEPQEKDLEFGDLLVLPKQKMDPWRVINEKKDSNNIE